MIQRLNNRSDHLGIVLLSALADGWWGLSLSGASTMLLCDPIWSQNLYDRLAGAIRRLGQTRPCTLYEFRTAGPLDDLAKVVREKSRVIMY
ncbi:hypothetical protein B0H67DRAFT_586798 [Lasiosphaeris hirsuta]|uniref:Helicase C-terminal domain-containing protein n=1 Tax=Lasiosphaeris hirsuta TaxID=260670 RepID=A0AA40DU75_9PEZI|nr:hypothetical protein B0H67DRAFT_586798 [Lasiosphaeris hirsuta]